MEARKTAEVGKNYLPFPVKYVIILYRSVIMTEMALLDMARKVPQYKCQELYDFAYFLVEKYANVDNKKRIAAFESENEMIDFINDIGRQVYEN